MQQELSQKAQSVWLDFIAVVIALGVVLQKTVYFILAHARGIGIVISIAVGVYGVFFVNPPQLVTSPTMPGLGARYNPDVSMILMGMSAYTIGVILNKVYSWCLSIREN